MYVCLTGLSSWVNDKQFLIDSGGHHIKASVVWVAVVARLHIVVVLRLLQPLRAESIENRDESCHILVLGRELRQNSREVIINDFLDHLVCIIFVKRRRYADVNFGIRWQRGEYVYHLVVRLEVCCLVPLISLGIIGS